MVTHLRSHAACCARCCLSARPAVPRHCARLTHLPHLPASPHLHCPPHMPPPCPLPPAPAPPPPHHPASLPGAWFQPGHGPHPSMPPHSICHTHGWHKGRAFARGAVRWLTPPHRSTPAAVGDRFDGMGTAAGQRTPPPHTVHSFQHPPRHADMPGQPPNLLLT